LFDCLAGGEDTLFIFGHVSGHFALVKSSGSCFQFRTNAAINPWFLVWQCFNRCCGYNIADALSNELAHRISLEVWNQIGRTSVEQA
jgi:hypothetical protein